MYPRHPLLLSLLLWAALCSLPSHATPPTTPQLRLEAGMHTAMINRLDVDASGRYLVTASDDKTLRLWDLADAGRLIRVLRVPVGPGHEGKLYATAISPDGRWIAAGGWTSGDDEAEQVYIFERASGQLAQHLRGLDNVVNHLCFSPDSRRLAAVMGEGYGLKVWAVDQGFRSLGEDSDYGDASYGCAFDATGRLLTTAYDGYVRLYDAELQLLAKRQLEGGLRPYSVAIRPDGQQAAVGFDDSPALNLIAVADLHLIASPRLPRRESGNIHTIAWSMDGETLYAAGSFARNSDRLVFSWSQGGSGRRTAWQTFDDTLLSVKPLPNGDLVVGSTKPAWGVFGRNGRRKLERLGPIADLRNSLGNAFRLSRDGQTVQFGYEYGGKQPARFAVDQVALLAGAAPSDQLSPARTQAPGLRVTDWEDEYYPQLNDQPIELSDYEQCRSLAISPDGEQFMLGSEWYVRLFDSAGDELWRRPVFDAAWGVNISADGRLAVAAFGNGTLHWYRLSDGQELLTLFPHADRQRWIAWTPSGYYAASPDGDRLIGWQMNRGTDAAPDFFPASQLRSTFYRPDVVQRVLTTLDEGLALEQADAASGHTTQLATVADHLPPVVDLLSPADGEPLAQGEITLSYRIRNPSGAPLVRLELLVDGQPHSSQDLTTLESDTPQSLTIRLPSQAQQLTLIAYNRYGASAPVHLHLQSTEAVEQTALKPELVELAAGCFVMGSPAEELGRMEDEQPHRVCLDPFAIGKYEVTFAEYDRFVQLTGHPSPGDKGWGRGQRPVIQVSWEDATAYAAWLSEQTGEHYRLPTEAEWEYAARAGTTTAYWWGEKASHEAANYGQEACCGGLSQGRDEWQNTAPVGAFVANPWGLHDTVGNVWEWTCSAYAGHYDGSEQRCQERGDTDRVARGGAWDYGPASLRSATRIHLAPPIRLSSLGFRLVKTAP